MEFKHKKTGARFVVPDRPTVREQLEYFSESSAVNQKDRLGRLWAGARVLMTEWAWDEMPDRFISLDEITNPTAAEVITWASLAVFKHMNALEDLPKNS